MRHIRFAGVPNLPLVVFSGEIVGCTQRGEVFVRTEFADLVF
jgi:hypothetical protein